MAARKQATRKKSPIATKIDALKRMRAIAEAMAIETNPVERLMLLKKFRAAQRTHRG